MDAEDLRPFVEEFLDLYRQRPIVDNVGGMGLNHCFGMFAVLRLLQPKLVVESGVWRGQSTWFIERATPEAEIVCLDPRPDLREYTSSVARYETTDFAGYDWSHHETTDALCFFDDHQNAYSRMMEMRWWGFRRAIMEDNFPFGEGDCYSFRHVMSGLGHPRIQMSPSFFPRGREARRRALEEAVLRRYYWRQQMLREPNVVDRAGVLRNVAVYFETPALLLNPQNNWEGEWSGHYAVKTPPLFDSEAQHPTLQEVVAGFSERRRELEYGYMCFVELRAD